MTVVAQHSDLPATLRAKGYRITPQRQLVLDAVSRLEHGTPDEICAEVQRTSSGVNLSTVYRTLELLEEIGVVTHTHLGHVVDTESFYVDDTDGPLLDGEEERARAWGRTLRS